MKNQSSIFLVNGLIDWHGPRILGAYTTITAAEAALDAYKVKAANATVSRTYGHWEFDNYSITEFIVDAAAAA